MPDETQRRQAYMKCTYNRIVPLNADNESKTTHENSTYDVVALNTQ